MGVEYRAENLTLEQPGALKFLGPAMVSHPGWIERFRNEVRPARGVTHAIDFSHWHADITFCAMAIVGALTAYAFGTAGGRVIRSACPLRQRRSAFLRLPVAGSEQFSRTACLDGSNAAPLVTTTSPWLRGNLIVVPVAFVP